MKTNNVIYNIKRPKIKKTFNNKKKEYKCIFYCPINPNDCINSIDINNDKIVFGTLMGDVFLCRVDEKKLNGKNNEIHLISKKKENIKSSESLGNKTDNIENDESNIKLNGNNSNNKYECIKLSINNSKNNDNIDDFDNDDNVKIFNKKKNKKKNIAIRINLNNNNNNENNNIKKNKEQKNEYKNLTNEENIDDEDENSNKYEKKLINKNMGKTKSSKDNVDVKIINKIDSKIFNEKQEQNKNGEIKNKNINFPQITKLIIRSKENIPCLEFENDDIINISIGDLEVIHLENMSTFNINDESSTYNYSKLRNYKTENEHIEYCENCTCMMSNSCYLIIFTHFANFNSNLEIKDIKYENKNLKKYEIVQGSIKMSNYVVPFDFDGDQFLFLDYISKNERTINIVYTATKKEKYNYLIKDNSFGHISHMKLLPNNKLFLCRNRKECEIHLTNKDFETIEKWAHFGEEVISCYIYINHNLNEDNNSNKLKKYNSNNDDDNEESNESHEEGKSQDNIKINIIKLFENKAQNKAKRINNDKTVNIGVFHQNNDKVNTVNNKNSEKKLISSNGNDNNYNYTESNQITYHKKNLIINNMHSLNPSFDNSSRRDMNFTLENKRFTSNRNSKTNSATKSNLLTNDNKKKKNSKNSLSSIEIYGKKNQKGFKNKINRRDKKKKNNSDDNMDDQTVINIKETDNFFIVTLDKDGLVNKYKNKKQKTLFNIYNISNIDNKYKKLEFFSVGFPYYIVVNEYYFGITTDHGLFVISQNNY